jgi:hypothetical protein
MATKREELLALAAQAAEVSPDMNEAQSGGSARLLPAGYAFGRLVEYIEFGNQPQEYNGVAKDPALEVRLGFALWGEGYQNDDGTPYILRPFEFAVSRNEKAKAFKLFKALNWSGKFKHFAELLGQAFLIKIVHVQKSKTDKSIVSRMDLEGFLPPLDPVTKNPYPIPEAADDLYRMFLWDFPSRESWDSLYVDGTWDDGKSKNSVQEKILGALNFAGSPLEQILTASAPLTLPTPETVGNVGSAGVALPPSPQVPASTTEPASRTTPAQTSPSSPATPRLPGLPSLPSLPSLPK